jgi:ATP-binding cassette subfamily F protein 3
LDQRLPNFIMELDELSIWYGSNTLVSLPKKIEITKDMRIWIIWKNWIWKTTLIKTILWELQPLYWGIQIHKDLKIWSYSQALDELDYENTILKEIVWPWISIRDTRNLLGSLLIDNEKMDQKIATLSWWEKAKVALTKMLLSKPQIIIMDEPTNHLDLWSKETIKNMLSEFNWVSIIVSHDRDFLEWTSNLLRVISDGQLEVYHDLERWFEALEESCRNQ